MTIVEGKELERIPYKKGIDVLRAVPNLLVTDYNQVGVAGEYALRGFSGGHGNVSAVFLDGAPLNEPPEEPEKIESAQTEAPPSDPMGMLEPRLSDQEVPENKEAPSGAVHDAPASSTMTMASAGLQAGRPLRNRASSAAPAPGKETGPPERPVPAMRREGPARSSARRGVPAAMEMR